MNKDTFKKTKTYRAFMNHIMILMSVGLFFVFILIYGLTTDDFLSIFISVLFILMMIGFFVPPLYHIYDISKRLETFQSFHGQVVNVESSYNQHWPVRLIIQFRDERGVERRMRTHAVVNTTYLSDYLEKEVHVYFSESYPYVIFDDPSVISKSKID